MTLTALFYLFAYGVGLIKALAGKPIWGLYVYFLCFYFHAPSQWWGQSLPSLRWSLIASLVTLIALFLYPPKSGFKFWRFRENKILFVFFLFVLFQLGFSLNSHFQMVYVELLFKFLLFVFLLQNTMISSRDIKGVIWVNLLGATYLAYMGMSMHSGGRLEGLGTPGMESANQLGQHFVLIIFMSSYLLLERFKWTHLILGFCLSMVLMALFMTESRGAIAALALTGVLALFFAPSGRKKKLMTFGFLGALAGAMLMGPQIIERFQGVSKDSMGDTKDKSAESRIVILQAQWEMFKESPWVGHGHRGTLLLSPQYLDQTYLTQSQGQSVRASHNVVAAFLVDHGVLGGGLYLLAIVTCGWRIWSVKHEVPYLSLKEQENYRLHACLLAGVILALVSFMVGGMGSNNKKLEGDIWILAIAPVIHHRMKRLQHKNELKKTQLITSGESV